MANDTNLYFSFYNYSFFIYCLYFLTYTLSSMPSAVKE